MKGVDLNAVFGDESTSWTAVGGPVATYTAIIFGEKGNEPGEIEVFIDKAEKDDITAYRCRAGSYTTGVIRTLDEAVLTARSMASGLDDKPDPQRWKFADGKWSRRKGGKRGSVPNEEGAA
ncbi:MAG: hypothetical protein AB7V46_16695 [Thermomicrobiales bacterium]